MSHTPTPVPVKLGGTQKTSVTADALLVGAGTAALDEIAPGTNGNVLTMVAGSPDWAAPAAGGMTSFDVAGDSGTPQTITNANTLTVAGGTGLTSVASATDTVTLNLDIPVTVPSGGTGLTTVTAERLLKGNGTSAMVEIPIGSSGDVLTNTAGVVGFAAPAAGFTSFDVAGTSGTPQTITNGNTLTIAAGTGITTTAGATDTVTVALSAPVSVALGGTGANLSATGGANQFPKQTTLGGAFTVGTIASADIATALTTPGAIGGITPSLGAFTTVTASTPVGVPSGGTGLATLTAESLVKGNGAGALVAIPVGANGTVLGVTAGVVGYVTPTTGTMSSFTVAADSGASQTISNADTLTIVGGTGLTSVASATDTVTINLDSPVAVSLGGTGAALTGTGAATHVVRQASAGAAFTVGAVTSADLTTALTTPPAIGGATPATGAFTTLTSSATTSGAFAGGFTSEGSSLSVATSNPVAYFSVNRAGTPVAGFGGYVEFRGKSDTTNDRGMARLVPYWTTVTDASRSSALDIYVVSTGTPVRAATLTSQGINSTAIGNTTPAAGTFTTLSASTPIGVASGGAGASLSATGGTSFVVKQASAGAALTAGLITAAEITSALTTPPAIGATTPGTGAFTTLSSTVSTALTNVPDTVGTFGINSTGTPAAGFSGRFVFNLESSTTNNTDAAYMLWRWADATHASRTSFLEWYTLQSGVVTLSATVTGTGINSTAIGVTTPAAAAVTGFVTAIRTVTNANYTAVGSDHTILFSTGATNRQLDLPAAASHTGRVYYIKKIDSGIGAVTVVGNAGQLIDNTNTYVIAGTIYKSITIQSNGTQWYVFATV